MHIKNTNYRQKIRNHFRSLRQTISFSKKYVCSQLITNRILATKIIKHAKKIAIFISFDGEINTNLLIKTLLNSNKKIYLPILPKKKNKYLFFAQYNLSTPLIFNRFKIYEPKWYKNTIIPIKELNIIYIPLVAFDLNGNRLGMGGGFYDKILYHWKNFPNFYPIGLAYDFQKTNDNIPQEKWDVPLPEIITPTNHWYW